MLLEHTEITGKTSFLQILSPQHCFKEIQVLRYITRITRNNLAYDIIRKEAFSF